MIKKLLLLSFLCVTPCFANDVISVQVRFKDLIFVCPNNVYERVEASATGGNTYEHTCADGTWTNRFIPHEDTLSYSPTEYDKLSEKAIGEEKKKKVDAHIEQIKNPPAYVEPSVEDYQKMIDEKLVEVEQMTTKMSEKVEAKKEDIVEVKDKINDKAEKAQEIADTKK